MKKKIFKLATGLMLMMAVVLLAVFVCLPAYETQAATVSTEAALRTALETNGTATITLSSDVSVSSTLEVKGTKTISGGGHTIKYTGPSGGTLISIKATGASLTINNTVLDGNSHKAGYGILDKTNQTTSITFNSGTMKNFYACAIHTVGNLTINGGTFTNNGASGINPGIQFSGATLKITGGEFCNSVAGAGLKIDLEEFPSSGLTQTATISGGSFHDNATNGITVGCTNLGVVTNGKSNLTITGGSFYNNTFNGISVMPEATVTVTPSSAVKIYGNKSVGIYDKGTVTFNGSDASKALVYGNTTYGVYVEGTLKFNNGKIYGTTSTPQNYGVYVKDGGEATLYSGASISGNTKNGLYIASGGKATSAAAVTGNGGAGISNSGTLTMNGGSSKDNKSYGVYNYGTFKMTAGTISGNQSYGVYNSGSTTITGGVVENNSGAYGEAYHTGSSFTLTGTSGSTSSVKGYVYVYNSSGGTTYKERYVTTNNLSPVINVRPCLYVDHGKIIQTSSAAYAETQSGSTLYPKTGWHLKTSGSNVLMCDCHIVKFQDYDGTVISSKTYHYGDTVTVPASPTRAQDNTYTYSFSGWSPTVSTTCKGAATYTAAYNKTYREYAVKFKDYDGTVISSKKYHYGDTVTVPTSPTRPDEGRYSYVFNDWTPTVSPICKGAATYTADYAEIDNGLPPDILYDETVIEGTGAINLYLPEKDGWFNAKTIKQIKQFSASDVDGDMTSFVMYDADTGALLAEGTGDGSKKVITYDFAVEGVKKYRFVAKDIKNGKVKVTERIVKISADFTVPVLTGDPGTEDATSGNSGLTDSGTASWSTVIAKGDNVFQTATDSLSGIVKLAVYPFSAQSTPVQTMLTEPFKSNIKMSDYPGEIGFVIKAWDKAGNTASKLVINSDNLKVRVEITLPRENFDK